jgi:hypothetical protein
MNKPARSQEAQILEIFRSAGYGVEVPLRTFPVWLAHEFNRAIHNLRWRDDLNIGNRTARRSTPEGNTVTDSFYTLYPGRWSDLRGKPELFSLRVRPKSWEEVTAERDEKMRQSEPPFELVP